MRVHIETSIMSATLSFILHMIDGRVYMAENGISYHVHAFKGFLNAQTLVEYMNYKVSDEDYQL
jgi:hypothetical protein